MKRWLPLLFASICVVALSLYSILSPGQDAVHIQAEDVVSIDLVTGGVPRDAMQKTASDPADIAEIVSALNSVQILRTASEADITAGGIGLHLCLHYADGGTQVLVIGGNGDTLSLPDAFYKIVANCNNKMNTSG